MKLSQHFDLYEFTRSQTAARKGIDNTPYPAAINSLTVLCDEVLEPAREHFGPIRISSGYRCERLNDLIGGSSASQHKLGQASDIEAVQVQTGNYELAWWIEQHCLFDQLLLEFWNQDDIKSGWVHVSYNNPEDNRQMTGRIRSGFGYIEGLTDESS